MSSSMPTSHFLSLPPSFATSPTSTSSHITPNAPNTASLAAADFDVDVRTGFLPGTSNIERLGGDHELWEEALDAARGEPSLRLGGGTGRTQLWRRTIETMPTLPIDALDTLPLLRRGHLVLSYLAHFYAHTCDSAITIPASISVPLLQVSPMLGLPPVVTYADTVLYNFRSNEPAKRTSRSNPPTAALVTFTGTRSEEQFYVISALCELAGAEALSLMRRSLNEIFLADAVALRRLVVLLRKLAVQIDRIGDITLSMMQGVDPEEFYHLIRPWFRGGDGTGGWTYLGTNVTLSGENLADKSGDTKHFSGPSAGQSSLIHAVDTFLSVDHTEHNESTFLQRMLQYMPQQHRAFIQHLAANPTPLKPLVQRSNSTQLVAAYDSALAALKRFREKHMRIASLYIVQQARHKPSERILQLLGRDVDVVEDLGSMKGTGGTPLFKFLRRCRDNTTKAMISSPAGPNYEIL